jgi:DNA-binding response OmpR family regulator
MASVLFIDDDAEMRNLMKVMLTRLGHAPTLAARGDEGLNLALNSRFDLVILDLMMPDVDGFEVTRRLRADARTKDIPILIFTARTQPADQEGAMQAGADGFLAKPIEPRELGARVAELLNPARRQPRATDELKAAAAAPAAELRLNNRVIVTLGLRGGVGATTLAVNLAGGLTQAGKRVCLVDLSSSGGLAALQLGLRPKASWADIPAKPDVHNTGAVLVRHISGLFVVASPFEPVRHGLARDTFQLMLGVLDAVFAEIVIRAAPVLDDATVTTLDAAQLVLLVVSPEVGAVQTAIGTLQALSKLSIADSRVRVVLNNAHPEPLLSQSRVEKALGRPVDLVIPYDRAQAAAFAQGTPLVFGQPGAPLAAAVQGFIAKL